LAEACLIPGEAVKVWAFFKVKMMHVHLSWLAKGSYQLGRG
jgi:hypothetical protein